MTVIDRRSPASGRPANGRLRRIFLLAVDPGEGRFAEPTAATQAWRRELVFMPHLGHSPIPAQRSGEGVVERRRSPCEATITASRALRISYTDNPAAVPAN
jgi:hypothetical protein